MPDSQPTCVERALSLTRRREGGAAAYAAANPDRVRQYQERHAAKQAWIQMQTKATAQRHGQRWTPDEDALVIEAGRRADQETVSLALGRSFMSVVARRAVLRKLGVMAPET